MSVEYPIRILNFPNADLTAIELLTFLPGCLRSPDIIYRFASNGISFDAILSIVNTNRELVQRWGAEYCYGMLRNTMRHEGHDHWTLNKHSQHFADKLGSWNAASLSVSGFRALSIGDKRKPETEIPFARLADGVKHMPVGDDALDLTRMVQHCVENPLEGWRYPRDYDMLLHYLGGPKQHNAAHLDRPIFERWEHVIPHVPRRLKAHQVAALLEKQAFERQATPQTDAEAPRRSGRRGRPSLKKRELQESRSMSRLPSLFIDSTRVVMHADFATDGSSEAEDSGIDDQNEVYVPKPVRWAQVSNPGSSTMSFQALQYAFAVQPSPKPDDMFDPYAFGAGPRTEAPFRSLHLIIAKNLKTHDLSGWAENIRWADEQHTTFDETGWTECPEHMERIAELRREQVWASAELVISIEEKQQEEEEDEAWVEGMVEGTVGAMQTRELDPSAWVWGDIRDEHVDDNGTWSMRKRPWPRS